MTRMIPSRFGLYHIGNITYIYFMYSRVPEGHIKWATTDYGDIFLQLSFRTSPV